jgi:hypothetical protein
MTETAPSANPATPGARYVVARSVDEVLTGVGDR